MKKRANRGLAVVLTSLILLGTVWVEPAMAARGDEEDRIMHGTATEWITEDKVNNTPPKDYVVNAKTQGKAKDGKYNDFFLEDTLQTVYIEIDENNLNYLLQNADEEPYVMTTSVTIGDVKLGYCGLKTKGSYTLEHAYTDNAGSDRFSFTVNFGKFIKKKDYGEKQNFYGCDKISFNNFFFDKSMMKEFFALKLMDEMGLPTPQYGLAKLYINGNYYGVYAMVEALDSSILEQYYNVDKDAISSYLCKPEGTGLLYDELIDEPDALWEYDEDTYKDVEDMLPTVMEWLRKINCLSEGKDFDGKTIDVNSEEYLKLLDKIMNVDEVVKYFAVHSWLCQMDNMFVGQKNYGLYIDTDGVCTVVPWDYDLSFGCYYPSTAELTANYNIDVMYRLDARNAGREKQLSAKNYAEYPLFNVIYQNKTLMDEYHEYMKECSKVAALGGTVESTGESYVPGFFNSYIEKMQDEVIAAATEKLASNVYYMNWIKQPRDVRQGLPNLAKIIALRSVGVYAQVEGIDTTVCATGCNLETLGNAIRGDFTSSGTLTTVDAVTGIFVTAEFEKKKSALSPLLVVSHIEETNAVYENIKSELGCGEDESLTVYSMGNRANPISAYTLSVPLAKEDIDGKNVEIYSYTDDGLTKLTMTRDDNIFSGETDSIKHIAVLIKPATSSSFVPVIIAVSAAVVLVCAGIAVLFIRRKKKAKDK
ncbi:MAG: hypothetical protein E7261_01895 [Lachnospiraceae bacterium]|nr:hypothetical protein [Lachnospiraceae bacterium]